ncbi:hypothetical protein [Hyalangium versicolor]|uniref:hypothetical protein n=1 Tax=Hyalangium versicolor TaxID=2861190 RepID=UPI001CCEB454|nr:hypothetical protein [Hyalangium versicolor]
MKIQILKVASLSLAALPLLVSCGGGFKEDIKGRWASTTCEVRPGANGSSLYVKREYDIQDETWTGTLTFFADDKCATPSVVAVAEGPYTIGEESSKVAGNYDAAFTLGKMRLTTKDEGTNGFLNSAPPNSCGAQPWSVNVAQDITVTKGCVLLGVDLQNCGVEYELVKLENDELLFGARPADGSGPCSADKRTSTASYQGPLKKVE